MQASKLLGALLPAHPDIQPILQTIRKKYGIRDVVRGDDSSRQFSVSGDDIDWDAVREELDFRIRFMSNLLPPELAQFHFRSPTRKRHACRCEERYSKQNHKDILHLGTSFARYPRGMFSGLPRNRNACCVC